MDLLIDFFKHVLLSLHPLTYLGMLAKETRDLFIGYVEPLDWIGNIVGVVVYYIVVKTNIKAKIFSKKSFKRLFNR